MKDRPFKGSARTREKLKRFVLERLAPDFDDGAFSDRTPLFGAADSPLDSISITDMIAFLEGEMGVRLEAHEINVRNFKDIETLAGFVERKLRPER